MDNIFKIFALYLAVQYGFYHHPMVRIKPPVTSVKPSSKTIISKQRNICTINNSLIE